MPLGVYWAGEYTFNDLAPEARWQSIEKALGDLAAHHVNAIWLTHLSASETADFARRAAKRGIYLVASVGELAGEVDHIRKGHHKTLIEQTLKSWGDAPTPIAWGLGDEPRATYMNEMATYVHAWRTHAPGEPVTTVVMWGDMDAASKVAFDALACDTYPFFSEGNPNSYGMPGFAAWLMNTRTLVARSPRPWMMGQSFQEPWGPFELDEKGNIVYLPGGAPHWVMPTPAQIRWQAFAAITAGAKGIFYFHYRAPVSPNPKASVCNLPAAAKEKTNSNAPAAVIYSDGRPTLQYEAMGEAFAYLSKFTPTLAPCKLATAPEAWETLPVTVGGNVVGMMVHPTSAKRYLMVVASYAGRESQLINITLGPHITGLKSMATGKKLKLSLAAPFRQAQVGLLPGTAELFECQFAAGNLPTAYADDFTTDKHKTDGVTAQNVRTYYYGFSMFSAADGGAGPDQSFIVYDVDKLLGPLPAGGLRVLSYEGGANPPDFRGAFWSASSDGKDYAKLSSNEFGKLVLFRERYLKVGFCWRQAGGPHYGHLTRFALVQWRRPA